MTNMTKQSIIYSDPAIHHALRLKAAESDRSISAVVNDTVKLALTEDVEDLSAFGERDAEPNLSFENIVEDLKCSASYKILIKPSVVQGIDSSKETTTAYH